MNHLKIHLRSNVEAEVESYYFIEILNIELLVLEARTLV